MDAVTAEFAAIATRVDLVAHHAFDSGEDGGTYYNYTFGALKPFALWQEIQSRLYNVQVTGPHMRRASMAMCSGEDGWEDYLLLYHFDPTVELDATTILAQ